MYRCHGHCSCKMHCCAAHMCCTTAVPLQLPVTCDWKTPPAVHPLNSSRCNPAVFRLVTSIHCIRMSSRIEGPAGLEGGQGTAGNPVGHLAHKALERCCLGQETGCYADAHWLPTLQADQTQLFALPVALTAVYRLVHS